MNIDPVWKPIAIFMGAGALVIVLTNMNWHARNLFAEFGWEVSAQLIYAASMILPIVLGVFVGSKLKSSAAGWAVGLVLFFASALFSMHLIDELPRQITWRIEAMRDYETDYDGSRP